MLWPRLILFCAIALGAVACEQHHVAELKQIEEAPVAAPSATPTVP